MVFKEENSESWREAESWGAYAADGVHGGGGRWVSVSNSGAVPLEHHLHPEEAGRGRAVPTGDRPQGRMGQARWGPSSHFF